jgi:hypothetical protein
MAESEDAGGVELFEKLRSGEPYEPHFPFEAERRFRTAFGDRGPPMEGETGLSTYEVKRRTPQQLFRNEAIRQEIGRNIRANTRPPSNLLKFNAQLRLKHQHANMVNNRALAAAKEAAKAAAVNLAKKRAENAKAASSASTLAKRREERYLAAYPSRTQQTRARQVMSQRPHSAPTTGKANAPREGAQRGRAAARGAARVVTSASGGAAAATTVLATASRVRGGVPGAYPARATTPAATTSEEQSGAQTSDDSDESDDDADEVRELQRMMAAEEAMRGRTKDLTNPRTGPDKWWSAAERYLLASSPERNHDQPELTPWNSTPHVGVPWQCRGLRPVSVQTSTEPWAAEAREAWNSAAGSMGFSSLQRPTHKLDRKNDDGACAFHPGPNTLTHAPRAATRRHAPPRAAMRVSIWANTRACSSHA